METAISMIVSVLTSSVVAGTISIFITNRLGWKHSLILKGEELYTTLFSFSNGVRQAYSFWYFFLMETISEEERIANVKREKDIFEKQSPTSKIALLSGIYFPTVKPIIEELFDVHTRLDAACVEYESIKTNPQEMLKSKPKIIKKIAEELERLDVLDEKAREETSNAVNKIVQGGFWRMFKG